ncbi:MAG: hypothetical protein ACLUNQ_05315 [Oscillospiraceae bacterium]
MANFGRGKRSKIMRLRKIAAFLMAALMALSLLACGSENETNPATSNETFIPEEIVEKHIHRRVGARGQRRMLTARQRRRDTYIRTRF